RAGAEQLRHRVQLDVHLEADHELVAVHQRHLVRSGVALGRPRRVVDGGHRSSSFAAASSAAATRNITGSPRAGASTWTPTGRRAAPDPKGTLIAGWPERFDGMV